MCIRRGVPAGNKNVSVQVACPRLCSLLKGKVKKFGSFLFMHQARSFGGEQEFFGSDRLAENVLVYVVGSLDGNKNGLVLRRMVFFFTRRKGIDGNVLLVGRGKEGRISGSNFGRELPRISDPLFEGAIWSVCWGAVLFFSGTPSRLQILPYRVRVASCVHGFRSSNF